MNQPNLRSQRLALRPFAPADAPTLRVLVDDAEIAANTATIPHPYPEGLAETWIASHRSRFDKDTAAIYAITDGASGELLGAIGVEIDRAHERGELGYWLGKNWWGYGLATEAAQTVLAFAFSDLGLGRVHAGHFPHNPASGRVLQKVGMRQEGTLRAHVLKGSRRLDLVVYGILRQEWVASPLTRSQIRPAR